MEKLIFDSGIRSYQVNGGGVLRFNPSDPNVYDRFMKAADKLIEIENELTEQGNAITSEDEVQVGVSVLSILADADKKVKDLLSWVFGAGNDMDQIFSGVNLMAVADNGERVLTNFINAVYPILESGAASYVEQKTSDAVATAKANRAKRRASR